MTGFTPKEKRNPAVNKRIFISAAFVVIIMFGSFSLREFFPNQAIIKKLFGGLNIFLFWIVSFYIFHKVDDWIFSEKKENLKTESYEKKRLFITKRMLSLVIIIVLLFFWSLQFFNGNNILLFWLIFLIIIFLMGLFAGYRRKKKK